MSDDTTNDAWGATEVARPAARRARGTTELGVAATAVASAATEMPAATARGGVVVPGGAAAATADGGPSRVGKYLLAERIASGGMADVFRATREGAMGVTRDVCIKKIKRQFTGDATFARMFIDEARISARLRHSNVVSVEDFGDEGGALYLVMEWVHGVDAARLLRASSLLGRPLPVGAAAFVVAELLDGLAYAHGKTDDAGNWLQIVHRDVSPHNVMVSFEGDVKLSDFGIAKATSRLHATQGDLVKGKLAYMAPEQAMGEALDHRADLFAAGVTAYELLTGVLPFRGEPPMGGLGAMLAGRRDPLRALRPEVPPALEALVDRLLAAAPARRPADAAEAREALAAAVDLAAGERALKALLKATFAGEAFSTVLPRIGASGAVGAAEGGAGDDGATTVQPAARGAAFAATERALAATRPQQPDELTPGPIAVVRLDDAPAPTAGRPAVITPGAAGVIALGLAAGAAVLGLALRAPGPQPRAATPAVAAPATPRVATPEARPAPAVPTVVAVVPATAPAPAVVAASPSATTPAPARAYGTVSVVVIPWGEVHVDGVRRGDNRATVRLAPGTHVIRGVQPGVGVRSRTVRVAAGGSQQVRINMLE